MANPGKNPKSVTYQFQPQAVDPANPREGDIFYSDGTPRDEGLWVYSNAAWAQISTGATLSVLGNLTLTPQSTDPGSPAEGMLFVSDGTARAEGLWLYQDADWVQLTGVRYQEFTQKDIITVRAASTANVVLASAVENGDSFGGVTLATNDIVLLKNQTTASENGIYVVQATGTPSRYSGANTAAELTGAIAYVTAGTNIGNVYYQQETLNSLSDNQTWSASVYTQEFTVPAGVTLLRVFAVGGGGGGGGGGDSDNGGGGGGGAGGEIVEYIMPSTPGETITITVGNAGLGGLHSANGESGGDSIVAASGFTIYARGGGFGGAGGNGSGSGQNGSAGGASYLVAGGAGGTGNGTTTGGGGGGGSAVVQGAGGGGVSSVGSDGYAHGGGGGGGGGTGSSGPSGGTGGLSRFIDTEAAGGIAGGGQAGGGGGGGASLGAGGDGGRGGSTPVTGTAAATGSGGGGGGGGGSDDSGQGAAGGHGGSGYVRLSW